MSVRSSHQADWYTSHRFWATSQQQGRRKVLDKGEPSQGQTEDRGTAWLNSALMRVQPLPSPLQALGRLPSLPLPQHLFQEGMEGMRTDKTCSYRKACLGHAAWLSITQESC